VWVSFVFPEVMGDSIFDLENGESTYTPVNTGSDIASDIWVLVVCLSNFHPAMIQ